MKGPLTQAEVGSRLDRLQWSPLHTTILVALGADGEYAIVNAAIAELIPARVRGKANALVMNFWPAGAILAGLLAYLVLDTFAVGDGTSWRYLFVFGGLIALVVLVFRRRIPESPRWLLARGRHDEAEEILAALEARTGHRARLPLAPAVASSDPGLRQGLSELLRHHRGRLALGALLDLAEAFGYYGIFALLSVVVLHQVHISDRTFPFFYIVGNVGGLAGGLAMAAVFDRVGHRLTVGVSYLAAAGGIGFLALATDSRSAALVTLAFVVANAAGTAGWTSAYPTFTELFPTHLRGAGVGARVGAIVGTLALPAIATHLGTTSSYLLVIGCWLAGVAAITVYLLRGGVEPACQPLELIAWSGPAPVPAEVSA